jgi:hypothetical protein
MKKVLLTIVLIAMVAVPASAADPVFSLWGDEEATTCGVFNTDPPTPYFTYYVYVFVEGASAGTGPDDYGIQTVEYRIDTELATFPTDMYATNMPNPALAIQLTQGDWIAGNGISCVYTTCNTETFWVTKIEVVNKMTGDHSAPGNWFLEALPTEPSGRVAIATCAVGYPKMLGDIYNHFGYNQDCTIGTKETSWGAIKSMY